MKLQLLRVLSMTLCNGDGLESSDNNTKRFCLNGSRAWTYSGIATADVPQETHMRPQLKHQKQHEHTSSGIAAAARPQHETPVATQKQHEHASSGKAAAARPQ